MEQVRFAEIAIDVRRSRKKLGLEPEGLAGKVGVSARFIHNLEEEQVFQKELLRKLTDLLKVLMFFKLYQHEMDVRGAIERMARFQKRKRIKIDRRQFGRVCSRRGYR